MVKHFRMTSSKASPRKFRAHLGTIGHKIKCDEVENIPCCMLKQCVALAHLPLNKSRYIYIYNIADL